MGKVSAGVLSLFVLAPCLIHSTGGDAAEGTVAGTLFRKQEDELVGDLLARISQLQEQIADLENLAAVSRDEEPVGALLVTGWLKVVRFFDYVLQFLLWKSVFFFAWVCIFINRIVQRPHSFFRSCGTHLIVLQVYYSPWCENTNPFCWSVLFLFFDSVVLWLISYYVRQWCSGGPDKDFQKLPFKAHNVYMDLRRPLGVDWITFLGQGGLVLYFMFTMNGYDDVAVKMRDHSQASLVKWLVAVTTIAVAGEEVSGRTFKFDYWVRVWNAWNAVRPEGVDEDVTWWGWYHIILRASMDFSMNSGAASMLINTVPIMLCIEDPLDFVKDVTAVFFIIKMDDLDDGVDIVETKLGPETKFTLESGTMAKVRNAILKALENRPLSEQGSIS